MSEQSELPLSPRENPDLYGQKQAESVLLEAYNSERLPHAWLLSGPEGIGKATLAYRFARFLLSQGIYGASADGGLFAAEDIPAEPAKSLELDPSSPVFRRIAAEGHGDLVTVERKLNDKGKLSPQIRIEDVRNAIEFAHKTASEGGYKIIIVDGAEKMNRSAENAFLKILEEPPQDTVILMVSHNPGRLLPTTRSRCRKLALALLETETVVDLLTRNIPSVDGSDAGEIARLSEGSIGRAIAMAESNGLDIYQDTVNLFGDLPSPDTRKIQALASKLAKSGADDAYRSGIELYRWWLSRIVLAASRGATADTTLTPVEKDIASRAASTAILPVWLRRLDDAEKLIRQADSLNLDRKQVIQSLYLSLA